MPGLLASNEPLLRDVRGTARTVELMHGHVEAAKLDPIIQSIADRIRLEVAHDPRGDGPEIADAVFLWVRDHGIFQRDQFQIEKVESLPASMLPVVLARRSGAYDGPALFRGDCDQYAMFTAALGGILGFQYSFETCKADPRRPDEFSHIWAALLVRGNWYPLDPSTPGVRPGWRPPVPQELFRRWPEPDIDDVGVGAMKRNLTPAWPSGEYPVDWSQSDFRSKYLWNIRGPLPGEMEFQEFDPGEMADLAPDQPAETPADITEPENSMLKRREPLAADDLEGKPMDAPWGPRPDYRPFPGYYHDTDPYAVGWPWSRSVYVSAELPGPGEEIPGVRTAGAEGLGWHGNGNGMGAVAANGGTEKTAEAGQSTMSDIAKIIGDVAATLPQVATGSVDALKAKYQARIAEAQARVATAGGYSPPPPPSIPGEGLPGWVIPAGIGVTALGLGIWAATR